MSNNGSTPRKDSMLRLPNARRAEVPERKVVSYLLATWNPRGAAKARFFLRFGFEPDRWREFAHALKQQAATGGVTSTVETTYGICYRVDGVIQTPDGRNPQISTVWQIDRGHENPRIVTAYPLDR